MSDYPAFDVLLDNDDGTLAPVPGATVHVYDVTNGAPLDDITADPSGHVPAGSLDVDAGTIIRFTVALATGEAGFSEVVTN